MQSKRVLIWELSGVVFLILVGSLVHFILEGTGCLPLSSAYCSINASVWEHLSLGFWTLILFSVLEYFFFIKDEHTYQINNFVLAKALGVLSLQGIILITFYIYTAFTGKPIVFIDLTSFTVGSMLCQFISYNTLINTINRRVFLWAGLILLVINAVPLMVICLLNTVN